LPKLPDSGFDRVASFYDALANLVFGHSLKNAQSYLLPFIPDYSRVLVIGGGSGWLLQQLLLTGKKLDILYLDASPRMLSLAQSKYKSSSKHSCNVSFRVGTEADLQNHEQFDVLITPFLLDLFPEQRLTQLMLRLAATLTPKGFWLFADFWPTQQHPLWWQKALTWSMYTFFGALSNVKARQLPDYAHHFNALGFEEISGKSFYSGFVRAKVFKAI
jgi:tRNA (cmo5U34)-methyltransferase